MSDAPATTTTPPRTLADLPSTIYFDREQPVNELLRHLKDDYIVAVIGENGSGKTTLVNVSLKKRLEAGYEARAGTKWRIVRTMPYSDPIGNLANALSQPGSLFPKESKGPNFNQEVEHSLRSSSSAIVQLYNQAVQESGEAFNFLLIVDQKQELFRYLRFYSPEHAGDDARYVNLLLHVAGSSAPIYVIFITDNRYFEHFAKYRGLPEAMNNYRYTVPAITATEILNSIEPYTSEEKEFFQAYRQGFYQMQEGADPYALLKSNLALSLVLRDLKTTSPLASLNKIGPMQSVIEYYVSGVFNKFSKEDQEYCSRLFKALSDKGGDNQYIRRPEQMDTLLQLINRSDPPTANVKDETYVKNLLDQFNSSNEIFVRTTYSRELLTKAIVDINSDALLANWPLLRKWIDEESTHANIYRNLVRDALQYYHPPKSEEELKNAQETIRDPYKGTSLSSARDWMEKCKPNETWAARYLPESPSLNQFQQDWLRDNTDIGVLTNFKIAEKFLELSVRKFDEEEEQRQREIDNIKRQRRLALIMVGVAVVALAVASVAWIRAKNARRNIELIDFIEILDTNGALDIPQIDRFNQKNGMIYTVVKNTKINTKDKVLDFLAGDRSKIDAKIKVPNPDFPSEQHPALYIHPADKEISYSAMLNLDLLFNELKSGEDHSQSLKEIRKLYENDILKHPDSSFKQYPYMYYTLLAHLKAAGGGRVIDSASARAEIEESALVSNPKKKYEYAFGDKNGTIFVNSEDRSNRLDTANVVIQGMGYSRDGESLFIGTDEGKIFRYQQLGLPSVSGKQAPIFTDPREKTVYFVEEYDSLNYLLVSTTDEVYFIQPEQGTDNKSFKQVGKPLKMAMPRVGFTDWSPDHQWFLATGKGKTIIYHLDPFNTDPQERIKETGCILHPDTTIMSLAIKPDGPDKIWLALGSEAGLIWIANTDTSILYNKNTRLSSSLFTCYKNIHSSTVIGLCFNPGLPQLASASYDGTIQLWNLNSISSPFDHIRLPNFGQSVSSITYINEDELVAHVAIDTWVIKTNIHALKDKLECIIARKKNCRHGTQ